MKIPSQIASTGVILISLVLQLRAGEIYKIDSARSTIGFGVHHFVGITKGNLKQFTGTVDLDRDHPERSSVEAKILVDSIDTGIRKRDDHLRSAEFFDVTKFPQMTFKSRTVKRTGPQSGDVMGDLTMHGVTKPVTLHVKLLSALAEATPTRWEVTAEPLKRRDFGLMFSSGAEAISGIGQDVSITMQIEAVKAR